MENIVIMLGILGFLAFTMIVIVPGKRAKTLETFGKPHEKALMPGLHFKLPWPITQVSGEITLQLQEIGANVSVKTKDNAFVTLPVKVQYRASSEPTGAVKAFYELEDPEQQITSYVLNNVRQSASAMDMNDIYQNRDTIEQNVLNVLQERFVTFGFSVESVLVDEPQPSEEVRDAFNRVIASQRLKEAAENEADAERIRLVGVATAEKESKKLQGEGIADMRQAIANGTKESMQVLRDAGLDAKQSINLVMQGIHLDTLGTAATHGNMIITDMRGDTDTFSQALSAVEVSKKKGVSS